MTASGENSGVKVRLDLDRASIRPGEVVWATLTVENTNDRAISSVTDGCATAGRLTARIPSLYEYGRNWPEYALASVKKISVLSGPPGSVSWLDQASWTQRARGEAVCGPEVRNLKIPPRTTLQSYFAWDGMVRPDLAAPTGPVDVVATLYIDDEKLMVGKEASATAQLQLTGGSPLRVSPGQAFDAALDDGKLAVWIRERAKPDSSGQKAANDVNGSMRIEGDTWVIEAARKAAQADPYPGGSIEVRVDARTGAVTSVAQRL